jgi:hypothetical protein
MLTFLLVQDIHVMVKCSLQNDFVSVTEEHFCDMRFSAEERRYFTAQTAHRISLNANGLPEGEHNLTIAWENSEPIMSFYPTVAINHTSGNFHVASFLFNGTELYPIIFLNNSDVIETALEIMILPSDSELLPVDMENFLDLDLLLNVSKPLDYVNAKFGSSGSAEIVAYSFRTELNATQDRFWDGSVDIGLSNVPYGLHHVYVKLKVSGLSGQFPISINCYQSCSIAFPAKVVLDGNEVAFDQKVRYYEGGNVNYLHFLSKGLYGYCEPQTYNLTFLSSKNLRFRVDSLSREEIEFLKIQRNVVDFNVTKCIVEGYDAYVVDITLDSPSYVSLGITIHAEKWFLRPSVVKFENIPETISKDYAIPRPNEYIDADDGFVRLWNSQVVGNESNPLLVASLIYQNLTRTLVYDERYSTYDPTNETASATLHNTAGVCRHFARAFAALAIASHLPTRVVIGTAFNLQVEATTIKKNHTWNEIYLPVFGWVPIDVTWRDFGVLPNTHSIIAYWEYEGNALNISRTEEFDKAPDVSSTLLEQIVTICRNRALTSANLRSNCQLSLLLDQAAMLAEQGMTHDTLLRLSKAYDLMTESPQEGTQWHIVVFGISLATVLAFLSLNVLRKKGALRRVKQAI